MKVHLIKTPEYAEEDFENLYDFLSSFNGPIEFSKSIGEIPDFDLFSHIFLSAQTKKLSPGQSEKDLYNEYDPETYVSWFQFEYACNKFREGNLIDKRDFVTILTPYKNENNWFSRTDNERNTFVQVSDWHLYTSLPEKYPVAYQVLENIMQSLMKISSDAIPSPYIHDKPRGCMNDFCEDKRQIVLKLQTANICPDCAEKIKEENIEPEIVNQVLDIFEGIRKEFLFKQNFEKQVAPVPITINDRKQIIIPQLNNLEIRLNPLFKTLYIFYLRHTEGVKLNELNDFKTELLALYKKLSVADNNQKIELRITDLVNPIGGSFSQKKSKLNKIITDLLGDPLAKFYRIEGEPGEAFKINIPANLVDIRY